MRNFSGAQAKRVLLNKVLEGFTFKERLWEVKKMAAFSEEVPRGYLALFLHAHLPFVRHPEQEASLEEKWFFEALTESYLPLILSWEQLAEEGVNFKLNLSLSPPLLSMLTDPLLQERYQTYLNKLLALAAREKERTQQDPVFSPLTDFYFRKLTRLEHAFREKYQRDLISPLARLQQRGYLEIITSCATHGYLPLILTLEAQLAQVRIGLELYAKLFGKMPAGIWLPECGYTPGIEAILAREGIKYFLVASHGLLHARPQPQALVYAPVRLENGVAVFGRDWETSRQVWSRTEGYPGDPLYREFYRDIGFDLDLAYLEPYLTGGIRGDTGFKYYRITGKTEHKEPYNPALAAKKAEEHAANFIFNREKQLEYWGEKTGTKPIVVAPYDAELFGHWWFEGPYWLEHVLRKAAEGKCVGLTTLKDYLEKYPPREEATLGLSSWGEGGYSRVWLNPTNDWTYPHLHRAEKKMVNLALTFPFPEALEERALNQAARELLLAQSSDWPFILNSGTTVEYATSRLKTHLNHFFELAASLEAKKIDAAFLAELEARDNLFPFLNFRAYRPRRTSFAPLRDFIFKRKAPLVLMLSWEYPPQQVGGLGTHVQNLAAALAALGVSIHVLTFAQAGKPVVEEEGGVYLHRLPTYQEKEIDFLGWVFQLNLVLADYLRNLVALAGENPYVVHAHDWLTAYAGKELKTHFGFPLVVTIHATEAGRNRGIWNPLQQCIHNIEGWLAQEANMVICCSHYMKEEVANLFQLPPAKILVIPNGVKPIFSRREPPAENGAEKIILYVGRLVIEKGVQTLLQAFAQVQTFFPEAKLIIAGAGPYARELEALTQHLGISSKVAFAGFAGENTRNAYLAQARVAVFPSLYEPFGIAALEAMAAGVPVVASATGGLAEIVEPGVTGLSFPPGDEKALTQALLFLLENKKEANALGQRAHQKALEDYRWEVIAQKTLSVYQKVLALHQTQRNASKNPGFSPMLPHRFRQFEGN